MATKKQVEAKMPAPIKPATPGERAAATIREFHALGVRVSARAASGKVTIESAALLLEKEEGISYDRSRKAALFGERCGKRELARICALCTKSGNSPLSINHVRHVTKIEDQDARLRLLARAAAAGLSGEGLRQQIKRSRNEHAGKGGRKIKRRGDLLAAVEGVIEWTDNWLKRYDGLWAHDPCWAPEVEQVDPDPAVNAGRLEDAKGRLKDAGSSLTRLVAAAELLKQRLEKVRPRVKSGSRAKDSGRGSPVD